MSTERPILFSGAMVRAILDGRKTQTRRLARTPIDKPLPCPYGVPGDRLWVRETWAARDVRGFFAERIDELDDSDELVYRATWAQDMPSHGRWFPSIHMPRWASRILLEVTDVRLDRLQAITDADILAEGVTFGAADRPRTAEDATANASTRAAFFRDLWDGINGTRGSWASNPWVWVVEFRRVGS